MPRFLYMLPAVMVSGDQAVFNRLEVLWRKSFKECVKLPQCCSNDFLDLLVGPLKDWGFIVNEQLQSKIKNRICDVIEQDNILYRLSQSLSEKWGKVANMGKIRKTGQQTYKNLPDNLEQLFYRQWIKCKEHKVHQDYKHLLLQHLNIGLKDFFGLILSQKRNRKATKSLQNKISELMKKLTEDD